MKKLLVALVVGALLALPMSAMAMDALTQNQLGDIEGQAGVAVGFGNDVETEISFSSLSWGDPDGVSGAASTGWLIIGSTSEKISITTTIEQGGILEMDVAYNDAGVATITGVEIPGEKTFLALALPSMDIDVSVPATMQIGFGVDSGMASMDCTMGLLNLEGLNVSMGSVDNLYVWCKD